MLELWVKVFGAQQFDNWIVIPAPCKDPQIAYERMITVLRQQYLRHGQTAAGAERPSFCAVVSGTSTALSLSARDGSREFAPSNCSVIRLTEEIELSLDEYLAQGEPIPHPFWNKDRSRIDWNAIWEAIKCWLDGTPSLRAKLGTDAWLDENLFRQFDVTDDHAYMGFLQACIQSARAWVKPNDAPWERRSGSGWVGSGPVKLGTL